MALGNIVGSNIANILLILGLSATIRPLAPGGITLPDILMVVLSSLLLLLAASAASSAMPASGGSLMESILNTLFKVPFRCV